MTERLRRQAPILAVVAAGGVLGAEARYAVSQLQSEPTAWPWATFLENVSGCLLIGILMTVLADLTAPHRLVRPFLGVGLLGGYTTFSTYAVDVRQMVADDRYAGAVGYLLATPVLALLAVWLGSSLTTAVLNELRRRD